MNGKGIMIAALGVALVIINLLEIRREADVLTHGREYMGWFLDADAERLWGVLGERPRQRLGDLATARANLHRMLDEFGPQAEILEEDVFADGDLLVYGRRSRFAGYGGEIHFLLGLDEQNRIQRFGIAPVEPEGAGTSRGER